VGDLFSEKREELHFVDLPTKIVTKDIEYEKLQRLFQKLQCDLQRFIFTKRSMQMVKNFDFVGLEMN
jgi:hypothetical protein